MADLDAITATGNVSRPEGSAQFQPDATLARDPLYIFLCCALWRSEGSLKAYQEVVAALDDSNPDIRVLAGDLLHRPSPRPQCKLHLQVQPRP